ncbi:glycine cleavage system aminomethyltransferase GcvT [Salirhabdus salicampi]|uniref:glycine cleavage system aminomethyltransferase GcvT n=1 Tax=Salirhabdus salicampi TaxID=476102 RepID=UPI0020C57419|nr:glycine cleavage system aminomethyltransferase GcvT [Salirhabdus salicampi]
MSSLKRTSLFPLYEKYGGKIVDFGGWEMPVQFEGIKKEHAATRNAAGLFDVSHMGEILVTGPDSEKFLQKMLSNDVSKLTVNRAQYTIMCYEDGGTVDDLLVYKKGDENFLLVVNAANIEKDFSWLKEHVEGDVHVDNISSDVAQIAIQGPNAEGILQKLTNTDLSSIKFFRFEDGVQIQGLEEGALVSRTGYTGEDGFEIYVDHRDGPRLWEKLLEVGTTDGLMPVGLGARDTLRFEATLPLYGQELTKDITPIEAGLSFAVKVNKEGDFFGKEVLAKQKEDGPARKIVGVEMTDKGIPRHGYEVFKGDEKIGVITSGTQSPTLGKNLGLAYIDSKYTDLEEVVEVQVRKRRLKAKVVPTPFYKRK